jgi:hypothetical protein
MHTVARWTHPSTLAHFGVLPGSPLLDKGNRASGIIGANTEFPETLNLLKSYRDACIQKEILAPEGANWSNHRFDQAVLTLLVHNWEAVTKRKVCERLLDITTHHDPDDEETARKLIGL